MIIGRFTVLAGIVAAIALSSTCGNLFQKSPEDVVKAFFRAANDAKYSEAEGYLASSIKRDIDFGRGIKRFSDDQTGDGKIKNVEILKVEVRGEGAKVYYKIHYKDGQTKEQYMSLIKENGEWRIIQVYHIYG